MVLNLWWCRSLKGWWNLITPDETFIYGQELLFKLDDETFINNVEPLGEHDGETFIKGQKLLVSVKHDSDLTISQS